MNINSADIAYFESFTAEINSKFRRLQKLTPHTGTSGSYHEAVLRSVIRNFLPSRFSVKQGFIYAGAQKVSKQIDILIIDENYAAGYLFQEEDFAVVSPEAVVAVAEIKTSFNRSDFVMAVENIASAKLVMPDPTALTGIIFGYDGTPPTKKNLDVWFKVKKDKTTSWRRDCTLLYPDSMLFFKNDELLIKCDELARIGSDGNYYHGLMGRNENGEAFEGNAYLLSVVLAQIINACQYRGFKTTDTFADEDGKGVRLMQAASAGLSLDRYSFGRGYERTTVQKGKLIPVTVSPKPEKTKVSRKKTSK